MLPTDFPHTAPEGYHYETTPAKQNYTAIWLCHHREYIYHDTPIRTIWETIMEEKHNAIMRLYQLTKRGNKVDLRDTTPYTAMRAPQNYNGHRRNCHTRRATGTKSAYNYYSSNKGHENRVL